MDEEQFFKEKTDSNIFKQVIYKYLPFWPLFVITVSISMLVAYIDLRSKVPIYVASAKVLLKIRRNPARIPKCWMRSIFSGKKRSLTTK